MNVTVLRSTEKPERLVCQAARGDYYDGYVGDTEYEELMSSVDWDEKDLDEIVGPDWMHDDVRSYKSGPERLTRKTATEARTKKFIEKQLSRGHYGPWEHPQITFAVEGVSRVTMAQITRHRHMTFDVQSQRYVDFSETEAIVPESLKNPDHFSRETGEVEISDAGRVAFEEQYKQMTEEQLDKYEDMVDAGIPKEDARFILPLGTPVNMTFSGNARTFMHVFNMRRKADSQWEIRQLSEKLADHLKEWMPYSFGWYEDNMPHKIGP
jgi:thymidylate synthase (FAD)